MGETGVASSLAPSAVMGSGLACGAPEGQWRVHPHSPHAEEPAEQAPRSTRASPACTGDPSRRALRALLRVRGIMGRALRRACPVTPCGGYTYLQRRRHGALKICLVA